MNNSKTSQDKAFIKLIKERIVNTSIGSSTLRGQRRGSAKTAREYLYKINLSELKGIEQLEFIKWLNHHTEILSKKLHHNWGAARKSLNIFLFEASQNIHLSKRYDLIKIIPFFETPLDNHAAKTLINKERKLWRSIKSLTKENSDKIQSYAEEYAKKEKLKARCYSDLKLWRRKERL